MPSALALRPLAVRTAVLLAASASVAFAAGCGSDDSGSSSGGSGGSSGGSQITASTGKEIFQKAGCVSCHTLADAGGAGNIGPNLDEKRPSKDEVVRYVTEGDGRMPAFKDRLTAEQIETVSEYVATVAGK